MKKVGDIYRISNIKGVFNYIVIKSNDGFDTCFLIYENQDMQNGECELNLVKNDRGEIYFYSKKDAIKWIELQESDNEN
jgi:hypothetical protein